MTKQRGGAGGFTHEPRQKLEEKKQNKTKTLIDDKPEGGGGSHQSTIAGAGGFHPLNFTLKIRKREEEQSQNGFINVEMNLEYFELLQSLGRDVCRFG